MSSLSIEVSTADGPCTTHLEIPAGPGPWPAVILVMDAGGVRPTMLEMAARMAAWGYVVAVPDFYHRAGSPFDLVPDKPRTMATIGGLFADAETRSKFFSKYYASAIAPDHVRMDFNAVLDALAKRPEVKAGKVGVTGYCMGGNIALRAASLVPDRLALVASFHGGNIAADEPDSPHLGAPEMKARVYVAGAIEDSSFTDEAKQKLVDALAAAHVKHEVETYPAHHGFAPHDSPAYDQAASERHFAKLKELFATELH